MSGLTALDKIELGSYWKQEEKSTLKKERVK